ncbi:hypothetical protein G6F58_013568 [Rhizopus delemar]|nr:hypothetical protein G6F58_013568 [Rhizopus delemar]
MRDHLATVYSGAGLPTRRPPPLGSAAGSVPFDLSSPASDTPFCSAADVSASMRRLPLLSSGSHPLVAFQHLLPMVLYPSSLASSTGGPHPQEG